LGTELAQLRADDSIIGLMVDPERARIEPIGLLIGHGHVSGLQALAKSHARNSPLLAEHHRLVGATGCLQPVLPRPWPPRTG
jgi:hypothetical protein